MKKIIAIVAFLGAFYINQTYAQIKVPALVEASYQTLFKDVVAQSWTKTSDVYRAELNLDDQHISAFFDSDGNLVATGRTITLMQLPISLQLDLKKSYPNYVVTNSLEIDLREEPGYYLTVKSGSKELTLRSTSYSTWEVYEKGQPFGLL